MSRDMNGMAWNHGCAEANGIRIHHVRHGTGTPLVLLHGWPEFWYVYRKNVPVLAERFDIIAPDLRGFGDTEKPGLPDPQSAKPAISVPESVLLSLCACSTQAKTAT
jgi:pimeloyl-ACP methyl ester carboxylesterase